MKRMWIGVALLTLMLVSGILVTEFLEHSQAPGAKDLDQAAALALEKDWGKAEALSIRARKNWEKTRPFTASLVDHEPMEEIDGLFAEAAVYAAARDEVSFSATCVYLAELLNAIGESHSLKLWNLM